MGQSAWLDAGLPFAKSSEALAPRWHTATLRMPGYHSASQIHLIKGEPKPHKSKAQSRFEMLDTCIGGDRSTRWIDFS